MTRPAGPAIRRAPRVAGVVRDTRARSGEKLFTSLCLLAGVIVALRPTIDTLGTVQVFAGLSVTDLSAVIVVTLIVPAAMVGWIRVPRHRALVAPAAFLAVSVVYGVLAVRWSAPLDLVPMVFRLLATFSSFLLFAHLVRARPGAVMRLLVGSAVLPFLVAIAQVLTGALRVNEYVREESVGRVSGTFVHPTGIAFFAGLIGCLCVSRLLTRWGSGRGLWTIPLMLSGFVMLYSFTRIIWIAAPIAFLAIAFAAGRPLLPLMVTGIAGLALSRSEAVQTRLSGYASLDVRQRLWDELFGRISRAEIPFGFGLGRVTRMVQDATVQQGLQLLNQVHNDYLRVLLETGVVGLVLWVAGLVGILIAAFRAVGRMRSPLARSLTLALAGCTTLILVASLTDNFFQTSPAMWFYWGLVGATFAVMEQERRTRPWPEGDA